MEVTRMEEEDWREIEVECRITINQFLVGKNFNIYI